MAPERALHAAAIFDHMGQFDPRAYWEERLRTSSGLTGVGYLGLGEPFNRWMYRVRQAVFARVARTHLPRTRSIRVLDVGSGTGQYLQAWERLGAQDITGSDLTATAVERLSTAHTGMRILRMDISEPGDIPAERFDAITCMDVLFHVVDDVRLEQALAHLGAMLKPDGVLLLSDIFVHGADHKQEHFTTRSLATYTAALERNGLRVVRRHPVFHLLNRPLDSRSPVLHRWWGLVMRVCKWHPALGGALAAAVYPLELLLVRLRREGVSAEIMVCVPQA